MSRVFLLDEYVDVQEGEKWYVGRVIDKDSEGYTIRKDGSTSHEDIVIPPTSTRIAPFRRYTKGYEGPLDPIRDDPNLDFSKINDVAKLIEAFSQKPYSYFAAAEINSRLRGRVFLFINNLFLKKNIGSGQIHEIVNFLNRYLDFVVVYFKKGFVELYDKFLEGDIDSESIVNKPSVAYAHFIYEAMESLIHIFGETTYWNSSIFEQKKFTTKVYEGLKANLDFKDPQITLDPKEQKKAWNSGRIAWESDNIQEEEEEEFKMSLKTILSDILINRFAALDGFEHLISIIHQGSESSPEKRNGSMEIENNKKPVQAHCPFKIVQEVIYFFKLIAGKLQDEYKTKLVSKLVEKTFRWLRVNMNTENKDLEIEVIQKLLNKVQSLVESLGVDGFKQSFYKRRETRELEIFLELLDSPKLEKKFKGLEGIKKYITRIEASLVHEDDAWNFDKEKELHYFDHGVFLKWLLDNQVIELIYKKYQHIELIKRSIEILRFIVKNCKTFPKNLINIIWESCEKSNEEALKVIYNNILELPSYLDIEAAAAFFEKFSKVNAQDYDEEFVDFLCKFTEKCLELYYVENKNGLGKIKEDIEEQYYSLAFGIPQMFDLAMDESPLSPALSNKVLNYILNFMNRFPIIRTFTTLAKRCVENIKNNISVCQSLIILREFLTWIQNSAVLRPLCTGFYEKYICKDNIIHLINSYEAHWSRTREKLLALKKVDKFDTSDEKYLHTRFIGKYSNYDNIKERLYGLKMYIIHPFQDNSLSYEQFKFLWKICVIKCNFAVETQLFLEIISKRYQVDEDRVLTLVKSTDIKKIFVELICNSKYFNMQKLTMEKFKCFEFFFIYVNLHEKKLALKPEEADPDGNLTSNSIIVLNTELTGLEILWNYLAECSDKGYVDEFCNLLVNIFTSLGPELQSTSQKIHQGVINKLMKSLETSLQAGNFQAIQVYIKFMSNFLDKVENRINEKNFETFDLSDPNVSRGKLQLKVKFHPYEVVRLCEFHGNDKLGKVKIGLAQVFDIDINDFDMNIDESMITGDDLNAKLKNYYLNGAVTIYKRYIDSEATSSAHLIVQKKAYIEKFFSLFAAFAPEKLKAIWDFFQKLPLQADIMREFSERTDFTTLLQDSDSISNNNLHRLYYYLSIIKELALVDPYYWKMPNVSMKQTKSDWASNFVKNNGVQSLINLITKTDFKTVPNFLSIKTLTLLYQMLRFFFLSYEHTKTYWNDQLFTKTLDILLYFTRYIATDMNSDKDIIKDYEQLFTTISPMLQSVVRNQKNFCKTFLLYPYLKELCYEIFINLSNEEFPSSSDIQDSFHIFLNVVLENVQTLPEKKCSSKLFQILLEQITFEAIESTKPAFKTLKVTAGLLKSYDLKKQFDCSIDIFQLMVKIVGYIVGFHPSRNKHKEPKLEACFFIIYRYLEHNEEKLEHFGQEEGLIEEILANGIFKVPTQNKKEKPKYQLKTLITIAFQTLTLLAKDERNLKSIIKFLLPMHMTNTWRGQKYASWALSSNNKKKTVNFAGLKNLGCTCYMNSTLQQLFMIPSFNKALFSLEDPTFNKDEVDDNMLFQLKRLFYGLNNIEKEFFSPKKFCLAFKDIEGNPTNFREQKDAFEFLSLLLERLEDRVKKTKHQDFIKNLFEGKFSSDVKCTSCPHFYEREEPFLGVNLIVKHTKNIQESLENFVASQSLTGDNAYECEKCKKKVEASRRVSFKNLPNYLIFGLSRFEYDFSRGVRIKINEYFEFSQELDMEPYTQQGLNDRENAQQKTGKQVPDLHKTTSNGDIHSDTKYSLKGVVVHVGVADSGHYYSLIKDKQIDKKSSPAWLEFNDTRVCEFDINQLSKVAFGDSPGSTPLQSAYILVYEKKQLVEEQEDIRRKVVKSKGSGSYVPDEKAMELEELEKETNYKDDEIAYIHDFQNEILKKNQKLFYIEKLFSPEYTQFLQSLIKSCSDKFREDATSSQNDSAIVINDNMLRELFKFIWNAYVSTILRSSDFNLQQSVFEWLYYQMDRDEKLPRYIIQYFSNENFFTEMILQCPKKVSRKFVMGLGQGAFRKIFRIDKNNESFFRTNGKGHSLSLTANFMCLVLNMLPKTKYYLRSIETYFDFFYSLAQIDTEIIKFILSHQGVGRLFHYFLNSHSMMETIDDPFTTPIIYTEYTIPLEYDTDFLNDPRKDKKEDFENPNLTNLSKFFSLLWLVMRYSYIPKRESYKKFLYYKSGINHELTGDETKLLELDSFKIYKLFSYLNLDDKKIRIAICKIIAFLSFGSMTDTSASLEYLDNALKQDTSDKTLEDCYQLIRVLSKVNDNFQQERNKALMENIISAAVKKAGNMFELNVFARTIRKLSSSSRALESAMKDNPDLLMKIIRTLREAINIELEKSSDKPTNHTVREQIKKLLGQHKDYFGDLKLGKKPETAADLDPASDLDDVPDTKFTRGQNVEYYDDVSKKYVKGIVDNVYEDLIKVKVVTGDGINHRWFDDPSHLHLVVDKTD